MKKTDYRNIDTVEFIKLWARWGDSGRNKALDWETFFSMMNVGYMERGYTQIGDGKHDGSGGKALNIKLGSLSSKIKEAGGRAPNYPAKPSQATSSSKPSVAELLSVDGDADLRKLLGVKKK